MNKKLTIIVVTLALAITGINAPAEKANAETTTETATETPTATPTPAPTVAPAPTDVPEPTDAPEEVDSVEVERDDDYLVCSVKDVIEITKGFKTELRIGATEVDWTSSNPDVISIIKTEDSDYTSSVVVEAKKYGKSTLTAKYAGYTTKIILKSEKNQYVCYSWPTGRDKGAKKCYDANQVASVKYDKKGNIVVKFGLEVTKWTKFGKKELRKHPERYTVSNCIKMSIYVKGKKVVKNYEKRVKKMKFLSLKKPNTYTVIIPKKYIKKKNMDLRKCYYDVEFFKKLYFRGRWL